MICAYLLHVGDLSANTRSNPSRRRDDTVPVGKGSGCRRAAHYTSDPRMSMCKLDGGTACRSFALRVCILSVKRNFDRGRRRR